MEVSLCSHPGDVDVTSFPHKRTGSEKPGDHSSAFHGARLVLESNEDMNSTSPLFRMDFGGFGCEGH